MSRMSGSVLFVGSVPGETAVEVMRTCAEGLGNCISCLPDGETGYRPQIRIRIRGRYGVRLWPAPEGNNPGTPTYSS